MSGGGLLPVGGYATVPALKSGLAIQGHHSVMTRSESVTTTKIWLIGSANTATTGLQAPAALHMTKLLCAASCGAQSGTPTVTITLWKTNQSAGSEVFAATSAAVATNTGIAGWSSSTVVNSGKDAFAANDVMLLSLECSATSCTLAYVNVLILWTWD